MKNIIVLFLFVSTIIYAQIGRVSTAGYTTWDWQFNGPTLKWCIADTVANGIHICWMWCDGVSANRNVRYNFYDFLTHSWNWLDGINVFTQRAGYPSMDNNPVTGCAYICAHQGSGTTIRPVVAWSSGFSEGPIGFQWPVIGVTPDSVIHLALIDAASSDSLWYSRKPPSSNWSTPIRICPPALDPMFPSHNLAASKVSNKVIVLWQCTEDPQQRAFYRLSNNSGLTWEQPTQIPLPPGVVEFNYTSFYAMFDFNDNFHFVFAECDTDNVYHCRIWHYCPVNIPQWSLVYSYHPDTLNALVGYNAIGAGRPTIVENQHDNYFYVAWEQFDSLNYEPLTFLSRADVMIAESPNNGQTWQNQRPITSPNTTSKRFPCAGGVDHDTLTVAYMIDSIAGFELYAQGRYTFNPIVIQRIKVPLPFVATSENQILFTTRLILNVEPNPFSSHTTIHFSLPAQTNVSLSIYDVTGRLINTLVNELKSSGVYTTTWNGRNNKGKQVKPGVYFCSLRTKDKSLQRKIILSR